MKFHFTIFLFSTSIALFAKTDKGAAPLNPQFQIRNPQSTSVIGISEHHLNQPHRHERYSNPFLITPTPFSDK